MPVPYKSAKEEKNLRGEPESRAEHKSSSRPISPTRTDKSPSADESSTINEIVVTMHEADDVFSKLKTELVSLQKNENDYLLRSERFFRLAEGMAAGNLQLKLGTEGDSIPFVYVPPGTFSMGITEDDRKRLATRSAPSQYDCSVPAHKVTLKSGYFISAYAVSYTHLTLPTKRIV